MLRFTRPSSRVISRSRPVTEVILSMLARLSNESRNWRALISGTAGSFAMAASTFRTDQYSKPEGASFAATIAANTTSIATISMPRKVAPRCLFIKPPSGWIVRYARLAALAPPGQPAAHAAPPEGEARAQALRQLYRETPLPDKPRNFIGLASDIPPERMQALLLAAIPAGDDVMRELALQRALAVRAAR